VFSRCEYQLVRLVVGGGRGAYAARPTRPGLRGAAYAARATGGARPPGPLLIGYAGRGAYTTRSLGADRFRHGLRNFRCVPRCRFPR
jgi:hypothetical protein